MSSRSTTRIRFLRPFTTNVFNRLAIHFAGWMPGFAILTHVGRKSGKVYRTPINVFRRGSHIENRAVQGSDQHSFVHAPDALFGLQKRFPLVQTLQLCACLFIHWHHRLTDMQFPCQLVALSEIPGCILSQRPLDELFPFYCERIEEIY